MGLDFTPKGGPDVQVDASFGDVTEITKTIDIKTNKELMAALADYSIAPKEPTAEEAAKAAEEQKAAEAVKLAEEAKALEETKAAEEAKALEDAKIAAEENKTVEQKAEEAAKAAEEQKAAEAVKLAEEAKTKETKTELVLDNAYRSLEEKGLLESQFSINEVYKLRNQISKMVPPVKPENYDDLPIEDKLDYRDKVRDFNAEVRQVEKEITYNNDRIKNIYDIRLNKFMEKIPSRETAMQFHNWLSKDSLGRARLSSSAMGAETIEEVYETFVKKQSKAKQRTEEKKELQKPAAPKFQTEKKTPVQAAPKTAVSSKFTRLSDPRNADTVKQIKAMWGIVRHGQKMTDEAIEAILENAERVG